MAFSLPFSAFSEPFFGTENVTDIQKRAENQFIMTGYQPISFRSDDCNISLPGSREPYVYVFISCLRLNCGIYSVIHYPSKSIIIFPVIFHLSIALKLTMWGSLDRQPQKRASQAYYRQLVCDVLGVRR